MHVMNEPSQWTEAMAWNPQKCGLETANDASDITTLKPIWMRLRCFAWYSISRAWLASKLYYLI